MTPREVLLLADRQLDRDDGAAAEVAEGGQRAVEARALAIEPVDDDQAGQAERFGFGPTFSVCTSTPATASTTSSAASATRSAARASARKLPMPGVSMMLILSLFHSAKASDGRERVLSGNLFVVVVGHRGAVIDAAEPRRRAGGEEERGNQLGLARAAVADDSDVADAPSVVGLHSGYPSAPGRAPGGRIIACVLGRSRRAVGPLSSADHTPWNCGARPQPPWGLGPVPKLRADGDRPQHRRGRAMLD